MTDTSFNDDQAATAEPTDKYEPTSTYEPQPNAPPVMAHEPKSRFDVGSFLAGLLFLGLGVAFVLEAADQWTFEFSDFRFIGPLVLIVIGVATLVGAGAGQQSDRT